MCHPQSGGPPQGRFHTLPERKAAWKQRNAEQAATAAMRQGSGMNYHNFASRLSLPRPFPILPAKIPVKAARKGARRALIRRPIVAAGAAAVLVLLSLHASAATSTDGAPGNRPVPFAVNTPTLIVTITGLAVALLRAPGLWRRDFVG